VALTGEEDYVSDGVTVIKISNGHSYLGLITGSGCMTVSALSLPTCTLTSPDRAPPSAASYRAHVPCAAERETCPQTSFSPPRSPALLPLESPVSSLPPAMTCKDP
jgi:hydroxyethylthiazole kinase-like sugar kinase family protein